MEFALNWMKEARMSVAMVATEEILVMRQHVAPMKKRFQAITAALLQEALSTDVKVYFVLAN